MSESPMAMAKQLRTAVQIVEQNVPEGADRTDMLRRLGLLIASLEGCPARECRTCGSRFGLSASEVTFYRERGLSFPTHCAACRAQRREERVERTVGP